MIMRLQVYSILYNELNIWDILTARLTELMCMHSKSAWCEVLKQKKTERKKTKKQKDKNHIVCCKLDVLVHYLCDLFLSDK